ncbi:MAP kinase kinase (Mkk2), putative, partial [Paecilomyces variotii No. 5]
MSSPAPLLKPPVPRARNNSGSRTPRLTLGIPPSPNARPVNPEGNASLPEIPKLQRPSGRPAPPQLRL